MPGSTCRGDVFHALQEITPVVSYLENRAYDAIDALHKLEQKKTRTKKRGRPTQSVALDLAKEFQVSVDVVRELADLQALGEHHPRRWQKEANVRDKLRRHFHSLNAAVQDLTDQVVRASSIIENINSRLRSYFFLRKQLGPDYLELLQFFLNHHRFLRSDHPEPLAKVRPNCSPGKHTRTGWRCLATGCSPGIKPLQSRFFVPDRWPGRSTSAVLPENTVF